MTVGAVITRLLAPGSTYAWVVHAGDLMLDLIVRSGAFVRLDRSRGFAGLPINDVKRLMALRTDDTLDLLRVARACVSVQRVHVEIPARTYELLACDDLPSVEAGFNEVMVWVGRELAS